MKKIIAVVLIIIAVLAAYNYYTKQNSAVVTATGAATPKDATYRIDGQPVTLVNGVSAVEAAPGSASKITTTYFGNDAKGDLNGDGIPDTGFVLTQSSDGSGTFYYAVAAIQAADGTYTGTDAVLLGDRIAPQTTSIADGLLTVNYADRQRGQDFSVQPSEGKSIVLKLDPGTMQFGEVAQNFEGEADPSVMKLDMHAWKWVNTSATGSAMVTPKSDKFSITFAADNKFTATTDCNSAGGSYIVKGSAISFSNIFSTKMFCEGSQESEFTAMLEDAQSYSFTSKGELVLTLKTKGSMTFK